MVAVGRRLFWFVYRHTVLLSRGLVVAAVGRRSFWFVYRHTILLSGGLLVAAVGRCLLGSVTHGPCALGILWQQGHATWSGAHADSSSFCLVDFVDLS